MMLLVFHLFLPFLLYLMEREGKERRPMNFASSSSALLLEKIYGYMFFQRNKRNIRISVTYEALSGTFSNVSHLRLMPLDLKARQLTTRRGATLFFPGPNARTQNDGPMKGPELIMYDHSFSRTNRARSEGIAGKWRVPNTLRASSNIRPRVVKTQRITITGDAHSIRLYELTDMVNHPLSLRSARPHAEITVLRLEIVGQTTFSDTALPDWRD